MKHVLMGLVVLTMMSTCLTKCAYNSYTLALRWKGSECLARKCRGSSIDRWTILGLWPAVPKLASALSDKSDKEIETLKKEHLEYYGYEYSKGLNFQEKWSKNDLHDSQKEMIR